MWIVNQNRNHTLKATNFWIEHRENKKSKINAGYGATSDDELWNILGEYEKDRAVEVFEEIIKALGSDNKYEMPKE